MSIILQNFVMLAQGKEYKNLPPMLPSEGFNLFGANVSPVQIFILTASILMMIALQLFVSKTRLGQGHARHVPGPGHGRPGGNQYQSGHFDHLHDRFVPCGSGRGHGHALLRRGPFLHGLYCAGIKAFTAAVLGGIGSIPGAMLGGFMLGLIENFGASYISSVYKDAFAFLVLIITLIIRPSDCSGRRPWIRFRQLRSNRLKQ